jgi:hypothetical protein
MTSLTKVMTLVPWCPEHSGMACGWVHLALGPRMSGQLQQCRAGASGKTDPEQRGSEWKLTSQDCELHTQLL